MNSNTIVYLITSHSFFLLFMETELVFTYFVFFYDPYLNINLWVLSLFLHVGHILR